MPLPSAECKQFIRFYFNLGYNYLEIRASLLANHDILMSKRTLHRRLRELSLFRRKGHTDILDVACFIEEELQKSGQLHGYRWMHLKCIHNGINIDKESVRHLLGLLDPNGVQHRARKRLQRRVYRGRGSNFIWHIDSYDKLKPFGICINGCIDGFSRQLLWLDAHVTSSDPKVIAGYYIQAVRKRMRCPRVIRADFGTENTNVRQIQMFLRRNGDDTFAGERSCLLGSSPNNQRIEFWWSILRKHCAQFWLNVFHELKDSGHFTGDFLDISLIQFCFLNMIQVRICEYFA